MRSTLRPAFAGTFLALLLLTACAPQIGPRTVRAARYDYGEALVQSWNEQLLLNLVRLRYRDNPLFLEVGQVVTHYSIDLEGSAAASAGIRGDRGGSALLGGSAAYSESPTITYNPLQGQDFVARLLNPISVSNLILFSQSGWSIERLMLCCVQRINGLSNAIAAAGPTPSYVPSYSDFQKLAHALRKLQVKGLVDAQTSEDGKTLLMIIGHAEGTPEEGDEKEVRRLLHLSEGVSTFPVVPALGAPKQDAIAVTGRSLLSVLFYLSQAVEVPKAHEEAGLVTVTTDDQGKRFDWDTLAGSILRVRSAAAEPPAAAVRVRYRGTWFSIADDDLNSKTTFTLLTYLFSLKAGSDHLQEPLLALGVR